MISALTGHAKEIASQNMLRWKSESDSSKGLGRSVTSHHGQAFIRIVLLSHLRVSCEAVSLARLVEAEIVSPYLGILIKKAWVTQPCH